MLPRLQAHAHTYVYLFLFFFAFSTSLLASNPSAYTDFLPRYRKSAQAFMISKISYLDNGQMVLHFRMVASEEHEALSVFGPSHTAAWEITTTSNNSATLPLRKCKAKNLRINDLAQKEEVDADAVFQMELRRGDIFTCELVFEQLPNYIKAFHLMGGQRDRNNKGLFNCYDIQVKASYASNLGSSEQMDQLIERFYADCGYVRYQDIREVTSLEQERKFEQKKAEMRRTQAETPIRASMQSDYMPHMFQSIEDIKCRERLILHNVYFDDNSADYSRRNLAMKTIGQLVVYLRRYPEAKIVLHGHTDIHGDAYRNLVLSKERVLTIKRTLVDKGIPNTRIITLYYGGSQPLPLYKDGGSMNRRVEIEIICSESEEAPIEPQVRIQASNQ